MADAIKVAAQNRKARHDYFIEETFECGIELFGTEVKSIRMGRLNLKDSYATVRNGEIWLIGMHISPYEKGNIFNKNPIRDRRLLMHKREIARLGGLVQRQGYALVPLQVYFTHGLVKVEIALSKGKKTHDKRDAIAERDANRDIERAFRDNQKE